MTTRNGLVYVAILAGFSVTACARQVDPPQVETPTLDVTHWTEKTELFMEYPPLVSGQAALFAVHPDHDGRFRAHHGRSGER